MAEDWPVPHMLLGQPLLIEVVAQSQELQQKNVFHILVDTLDSTFQDKFHNLKGEPTYL